MRQRSSRASICLRAGRRARGLIRAALLFVVPVATVLVAPAALWSQTVSFAGAQTTVRGGVSVPEALAVDAAGNLFIADSNNGVVVKVPANGGAPTTVAQGLSGPTGVAVDGAGNVFIAEPSNNRVLEAPAGGGDLMPVASGLTAVAVAVDRAGNLFIADYQSSSVVEVPAGGGSPTTVVTGLRNPEGVTVDAAGNLFIADSYNNRVVELPAGGGALTTVASGLNQPRAVAVDGAGNVFITDSGNNQVLVVSPGGGSTSVGSGLYAPVGVAVDGAGNVFIADRNNRVLEVSPTVNGGAVNVCPSSQGSPAPCSQTLTLIYNVTASGTLGAAPTVVTQGAPNLDFTLASGSTCTGDVTAGSSCTVNVTFAPLAPGLRTGAVELTDASGNLLAANLAYGQGQGPAIAFDPGVQAAVGTGIVQPTAVAVDGAGNVFVAEISNLVVKVTVGGGAPATVVNGLNSPTDLAVDGMGNLFIADSFNNRVVKIPASGGPQTTVGNGLNHPNGVAVDGTGNVFIADYYNSRVVKVPADGGAQTTVGSGLNFPGDVAVDGAGNVFIADSGNGRVLKLPADGGAQTTVGSGLYNPIALAVDGAGNVFIGDTGFTSVVKVSPGGAQTAVGSGLGGLTGVAVDGSGNVFVSDLYAGVVEVQRSQPPALSFAPTPIGGTSTDSPQSITVENVGNAPLSLNGLIVDSNFAQVTGSGTPADCTSSSPILAPGESCNINFSFTPTVAGPITGAATLTDNSFNVNSATQTISLSGVGQITPTITFNPIPNQVVGGSLTLSATASSGLPVSFASLTTAVCTVSGTTATFVTTGTCTIQASQSGNANFPPATPVSQSFSVIRQSQTITFNPLASQVVGGSHTLSASATSGLPVSFTSLTPTVCTVSGTTATFVTVGTCTIRASQSGNATYAAATPVSRHPAVTDFGLTVTPSSQTVSLGQTAVYTAALQAINGFSKTVTLSCTGAPACSVSPASVTLPTSSSSSISVATSKRGTFILTIAAKAGADIHAAAVVLKVQ